MFNSAEVRAVILQKFFCFSDLAIREEFDLTKQATIDESQQFQKKLNALIENVNDLTKDQSMSRS